MDSTVIIRKVKQSPQVAELLARVCDFELVEPGIVSLAIHLQSGHYPNVIAQDCSGGMFALCEAADSETQPVLYISSEGEAGIIADDFVTAPQLMIQLPYWRDCLKFSGGGQLEEMYKAIPYLEQELRQNEPKIDTDRKTLLESLELAHPLTPVDTLYHAVKSTTEMCGAITHDRSELGSLFNTFVVIDNPLWRAMSAEQD